MNRMEDAKKKYEDIPVPEALGQRVQAAVARSKEAAEKETDHAPVLQGGRQKPDSRCGRGGCLYPDGKYKYRICGYGQRDSCCRRGG